MHFLFFFNEKKSILKFGPYLYNLFFSTPYHYPTKSNRKEILKRKQNHHEANKSEIAAKKACHYSENKDKITQKERMQYAIKKASMKNCEKHREAFFNEIDWGPIFPCISCRRDLFLRGVSKLSDEFYSFLLGNELDCYIDLSLQVNGINSVTLGIGI